MTAYQSIFQKRSRPVTSIDFEQTASCKVFSENSKLISVDEDIQKWNMIIPFLPQDFSTLFQMVFDPSANLQIVFDGKDDPLVKRSARFYLTDHLGDRFGKLIFSNGILSTPRSDITVKEENRGQGYGKKWFRFLNELCIAFGHDQFEFTAGSTNGGYTWARAGAYIDLSPQKYTALTHLREKILQRLDAIRPYIPPDIYGHARALGRVVAKDDLARLANMDYCFSPESCQDMESWDGSFLDSLSATFGRSCIVSQVEEHGRATQVVMSARTQGVPLNIGRYLLTGTTWDAAVDFNDVNQMKSIGDYVGGWKTIRPIDKKTPVITPALIER